MNAFSIPQNRELTLRKFGDSKLLITWESGHGQCELVKIRTCSTRYHSRVLSFQ